MKRLLPKSLLGQVTLVLAIGLMAAQIFAAITLYRAGEQRRDASIINSIAFRLIAETSGRDSDAARRLRQAQRREVRAEGLGEMLGEGRLSPSERQERRMRRFAQNALPVPGSPDNPPPVEDLRPGTRVPFGRILRLSFQRTDTSPVLASETRIERYEEALKTLLDNQEVPTGAIQITRRRAGKDSYVRGVMEEAPGPPLLNWERRTLMVAAIEQPDGSGWFTVRLPEPRRERGGPALILGQTLFIFVVLLSLLYLVLRRLTRPLAVLTERVSDFSKAPETAVRLEESGPSDIRRLIAAHNAMEARIAAMLDEKDVMLGAIGHDLKTPLAALRVRIESVPDEAQRARMADSIEDITRTLDDILSLARIGRSHNGGDGAEAVDLGALVDGVVEEFEDLGEPVTLEHGLEPGGASRIVARIEETWLKRALRNLVSNAVRYGGAARVSLLRDDGPEPRTIVLRVDDDGPGIAEDRIADMFEPFTRGEASRNRATGGTGLGLTLARAIAVAHDGELVLENRIEGGAVKGLRAEIRLPA